MPRGKAQNQQLYISIMMVLARPLETPLPSKQMLVDCHLLSEILKAIMPWLLNNLEDKVQRKLNKWHVLGF